MKVTRETYNRETDGPFFGSGKGIIIPFRPRATETPAKPSQPKSEQETSGVQSQVPVPAHLVQEVREQWRAAPTEEEE